MRKNWKRLSALLLALVMVLSLVPVTALAARREDDAAPMIAPDTAVNEAKPAGAVDAADIPAVLAEGEEPDYTFDNINAGLFDVGVTVGGNATDGWTATYSNPEANPVVTASAGSYYGDTPARLAVDGTLDTNWHSNWNGSNSGNGPMDLQNSLNDRYIQLDLTEATTLSALRYLPGNYANGKNGIVTRYEIKVCADDTVSDSSTWTTVATANGMTNWDNAANDQFNGEGSGDHWFIAYFDTPATTKHVRLYGVETRSYGVDNNKFMSAREVRLVKAGELAEHPEYTLENVNAGLFDVGANPFKNADGTWTVNYNNPAEGSGTSKNGTVIKATAESYRHDYPNDPSTGQADCIPYAAVDGYFTNSNKWHTNYSDGGTGTNNNAWKTDWATKKENAYIQLEIVGGAMKLAALRYIGNNSNGWISKYRVTVSTDGETWTEVARGTWTAAAVWQLASFDAPCDAKYVRLYSNPDTVTEDWYINAREVRLVKAGTEAHTFTGTVMDSEDNGLADATVSVDGTTATTGSNGSFTLELPYPTCIATVTKDGYKTRAVALAEGETAEIKLYAPLSGDALAGVNNHLWDYPLWADVKNDGAGTAQSPHYHIDGDIHGGSVTAFSWEYHNSNEDLPPWAAIDGNTATHWHSRYGDTGQAAAADNVGKWYEFTLDTPTEIIGLWYMRRASGSNQPGNVTVKVSNGETSPSTAEWAALPSAGSGNMNATSQDWVFVELSAPVEAKYVRIYPDNPGTHVVIAELRVVMDPETSGAKHLTGAVTASVGGAAIEGATLKVANHTATSGADGAYDLGYLPAGTYTVTASATGYQEKTQTVTIEEGDLAPVPLQLETQELTLNVTVTADGNPVDGATVILEDSNKLPVANVTAATASTNGVYTLDATQAGMGTFVARVSHPEYNIGTATVTFNNTTTTVNTTVALTARSAPSGTGGELVKEYDFSDASQVADFVPLVADGGATVAYDETKHAMKITFVNDDTSYKNLILNKKFVIKNGSFEFDVTAEGTVADDSNFGTVFCYGDGKWLHLGQLNAVNHYGATTHSSATESASHSGGITNVAMGDGVTRRFHSMLGVDQSGFTPNRSRLDLESLETSWKYNHDAANLPISNTVGLWGFDAKNANGLVVYIDNLKVYRRTEQKSAVTIGELSAGDGTLAVKTVTELDTEGTALTSGGNAFEGDTIKISATGVPEGKVFAVKVTRTGEATTVVSVTKAADGSFTFTMPAYPVTITPSAATQLTNVTVTGANYGETNAKYARVGNTLKVSEGTTWGQGVSYQWQHSADGTNWDDITGANAATFVLTNSQYNSSNTQNQVRVVVTGNDVAYTGTVESAPVDVKAGLVEVSSVTFAHTNITMWSNYDTDPVTSNGSEEGKTTVITATITPSTASRPMTVTWASSNTDVIGISNESTTAETVTTAEGTVLRVSATLTAKTAGIADITCTVTAKDGTAAKVATVRVTAKTAIKEITLTGGGKTLNSEADVLTIYANDGDDDQSVNVTATVNEGASATGLVWACNHEGDHIFVLGDIEDEENAGVASGDTVAITAYDSHDLVGEETVTVTAPAAAVPTGVTAPSKTFTVKVVHKIGGGEHSVSISGTPKVGNQLSVNLTNVPMSSDDKGKLTYQWNRNGTAIQNATNSTYTLGADDVDATITVTVTATPDSEKQFYYEGSLTSNATAAVEKLDTDTPKLSPTKPSQEGLSDGFITISNYDSNRTYQIKGGDYADWTNVTFTTAGKIDGLRAGTYSVKVVATTTQKESAEANATIVAGDAVEYTITATDPDEGATISVSPDKATKGDTVTISIAVTAGYKVDAVMVNDSTDGVTKGTGNTWTFAMPEENVTVTAEVSKIMVKIYHVLNNSATGEAGLTCSLGTDHLVDESGEQYHEVAYGTAETTITLTAAEGYNLPTGVTVTTTDGENLMTGTDPVTYSGGVITFPNGVTQDITITATASPKTFNATFAPASGSNLTGAVTSTTPIPYNTTLTATLTPASGYSVPAKENVQVTVGGTAANFDYSVNETSGVATITINNVKGSVVITASGVKITTPLDSVSIEITHDDDTVSNQDVPHVGDVLTAKPVAGDKTNVTASYTWYVGGVEPANLQDPTGETYTVRTGDKGKKIKVVATGTGDFSGTATSAETEPVGDKVFAVDGVKIQNNGSDVTATTPIQVTFGGTLQLTAVVSPDNATNKKVSWTSSAPTVATVNAATGKVTAAGVGDATITVTTEDGNRQATCKVRVTAKDLTNDATATVRVGGTLELGETVNAVLVPADAANGASYSWYIVDADGSNETPIMDTDGATATLPTDSSNLDKKVKLVVTYGGNYTGNKTRITANAIAGELPDHDIRIDSAITNGSVAANPTKAKAGVTVTLTVTPATGYELGTLTVTAGNYATPVETDKVNDTTYTFIMPDTLADTDAVNVTATFVEESETPPVADKDGLKALIDEVEALTKADYTAESWADLETALNAAQAVYADEEATEEEIAEAATALETAKDHLVEVPKVDISTLDKAIKDAETALNNVDVAEKAEDVPSNKKFVTSQDVKDTLANAIADAKTAMGAATTQADVDSAKATLAAAVTAFNNACQQGTKKTSSRPSSSTSTVTNPDGSVTTTVTKPDGTKVATTEKPDGTVETVETKPDGTKIETVETPDGTTETVKTQPDGTVVETVVAPDGTKESVMTRPDGTVTETVIDTEGAMTEKVTDPEENVVITVTDPEGEELAKVELPATVKEPETKFDDIGGHWAEDSINKVAALGLVNGVGDNKYGTESSLTRGQLATVLYRLSNGKSGYRVSFSDVEIGKYYTDGVAWAAKAKIVTGYSADIFAPNDTITREQLATMLCRYAKLIGMDTTASASSLNAFTDGGNTGKWAVDGVAWCVEKGILRGMSAETLAPNSNVTRAQVAVMLDRFIALIK